MIGHLHPIIVGPPLKLDLNPSKQSSTIQYVVNSIGPMALLSFFEKSFHHTYTSGETHVVERN